MTECDYNGLSGLCGPDCPAYGSEEECPEEEELCRYCDNPIANDEEEHLCLICQDKVDNDRKGIAGKWKELDDYYHPEMIRIQSAYHIETCDADEGIDINFFFKGRYTWAQLEWHGEVSNSGYFDALEDYQFYCEFKSRIHDIARAFEALCSHVVDEIERFCQSLGYDIDWEERICLYRRGDLTLSSSSYETDWTCIEVDE